jgi:hypothetical protein
MLPAFQEIRARIEQEMAELLAKREEYSGSVFRFEKKRLHQSGRKASGEW